MNNQIDAHLRVKAVIEATGISKATIYRMMHDGMFPRPKRVGLRSVAWSSKAIAEWLDSRSAA
jgi:prophage regulatory protein